MIRYLSVCSGIEATTAAWHPLGWEPVAFCEIDKFPSRVLAHHYPHVPNLGDFTAIDVHSLGCIDLIVGGTPCQGFSVAGLRGSLSDARSNLALAYVILAHELARFNGIRNAVWENVPGVLNTPDNAFGCFLGALVGADDALHFPAGVERWPNAGMVAGPRARLAWRVLDAQYFGLAQRRKRVFVVSDFGSGADPAAVLFERQGVHGNPPPRREARKDAAPTLSARTKGGGGFGTDFDLDGGLIAFGGNNTSGPNIRAAGGGSSRSYVADPWAVRRLTPLECERLQGFPEGFTAIPGAADGPRYKALGNSMAVPVMAWIGKRIDNILRGATAAEWR